MSVSNLKRRRDTVARTGTDAWVADGRVGKKKPRPILSFAKEWKKASKPAGCLGRIPYDLRRTAGRDIVRADQSTAR